MSKLKITSVVNAENFYRDVELFVKKHKMQYIDAVIYYCESNNIEVETVATLVKSNSRFKACIQIEGEDMNMFKTSRRARLPL